MIDLLTWLPILEEQRPYWHSQLLRLTPEEQQGFFEFLNSPEGTEWDMQGIPYDRELVDALVHLSEWLWDQVALMEEV